MSTSLSVALPDGRQWSVSRPPAAILQSVLEDACAHFQLDAATHRLEQRDARGNGRPVDHTLSIRIAQLPINARLHLASAAGLSPNVHLTLSLPGQQPAAVNAVFPVSSTLQAVMVHFARLHPQLQLSSYAGVPPADHHERYSVHINVPGVMAAVMDTGCRKVTGDEAVAATTLAQLGFKGEEGGRAGKGRLKLTHSYQQPAMSESEQAAVMQRFSSGLQKSVEEVQQKRREKADEERRQQEEEAALRLPADRQLRVLQAQPSLLPAPELPDSFYEVTEEDSVEYARSVMRQAAKERGEAVPAAAATTAPGASRRKRPLVSLVRVKLPCHVYVEAVFKASERVADVMDWLLTRCIRDELRASVGPLFVTPPKRALDARKTLREEGLLGSVLLHAALSRGQHALQQGVRRGRETAREEESKEGKDEAEEELREAKEQPQPAPAAVADDAYVEWLPEQFLSADALAAMQTIRASSEQVPPESQSKPIVAEVAAVAPVS